MTEHPDQPEPVAGARVDPWQSVTLGNDQAKEFTRFYEEDIEKLIAFLIYQGASSTDAREIAQDAMAEAFRLWVGIAFPKSWVRTVASRAYIRRAVANREDPVSEFDESARAARTDDDLDAFVERDAVVVVLRDLPFRQRQVMAWTWDGYSPGEIAVELGISADTVRASLYKARTALAEGLGPWEEADRR
jgi:RNA polymerase sigma-70 factor (ECF subfamily)